MSLSPVGRAVAFDKVQEDAAKLTVWIRASGVAIKPKIAAFVKQVFERLPNPSRSEILVCTSQGDTILDELALVAKTYVAVKVIFANMRSFREPLTTLAQNTDFQSPVLSLSVGIDIRKDQIEAALKVLTGRVHVYGWSVKGQGNDGSAPGKGWYHTAALIDHVIVSQVREGGIPSWVDNGVLGKIGESIIGGNEEIPIMVKRLQVEPEATFILNASDPVSSAVELGLGISFQEKIRRKTVVSDHYLQKMHRESGAVMAFALWQKRMWESLKVI